NIEGRLQALIASKHGNLISMTAINMHDSVFDNVFQFQFYQDAPGKLILQIQPKPNYNSIDEEKILKGLHQKLNNQFDITVQRVERIVQTGRGKTSFLVQKLPVAQEWGTDNG